MYSCCSYFIDQSVLIKESERERETKDSFTCVLQWTIDKKLKWRKTNRQKRKKKTKNGILCKG